MQLFPFRTCSTYVVFFELVTLSLFGGFEGALLTNTAAVGALQFLKKTVRTINNKIPII